MKRIILLVALLTGLSAGASGADLNKRFDYTIGFTPHVAAVRHIGMILEYVNCPDTQGWNFETGYRVDRVRKGGLDYFTIRMDNSWYRFRSVVGDNGTFEGVPVDCCFRIGISIDLNCITVTDELGTIYYFGDNPGEKEPGVYREFDTKDRWASSWLLRRIELPGSSRYYDFKWERMADGKSHMKEIVTPFEKTQIRYQDGKTPLPTYIKSVHENKQATKAVALFYTDGVLSSARVSAKGEYTFAHDPATGYLSQINAPDGSIKRLSYSKDGDNMACALSNFSADGKLAERIDINFGYGLRTDSRKVEAFDDQGSSTLEEKFFYEKSICHRQYTSTSDGHFMEIITYYPEESIESASPEQKVVLNAMLGLNMVGARIKQSINKDGKIIIRRYEMGRFSDITLYLPAKMYQSSPGEPEKLVREYNWDKYGDIVR